MDYADVIAKWGRKLLMDAGKKVNAGDPVYVDLGYETGGGCETCEYTEGVIEVRSGRVSITVTGYTFTEALNELIKIAADVN